MIDLIIIILEVVSMSLFNFGKKKKEEPAPNFVTSVPYSDHYRGYKRLKLATYQDKEADKGIEAFKAADAIKEITFQEYLFPDTTPLLRVYGDGHKLGTIWKSSWEDYYKAIKNEKCEKASVAFNDLNEVFLFIKLK